MTITGIPVSDSSFRGLAKLTDLKSMLGATDTSQDSLLTLLLARATDQARQLSGATSIVRTSTTIYPFDPNYARTDYGPRVLRLDHGVIESITSIKQRYIASDDWDTVDAYTEGTDYIVEQSAALIEAINTSWTVGQRKLVQVVGVFGYYDPNSAAPTADAIAPPEDLQHGILEQAQWLWRRRDLIGTSGITLGQGGAVNIKDQEIVESLKNAVNALPFRRII